MKRHLLVLGVVASLAVRSEAKKPPQQPLQPTQQDIVNKCEGGNIVVANITYQYRQQRGLFVTKDTGVSATIGSSCTGEGEVSITVDFYNGPNNVDTKYLTKLVAPGAVVELWASMESPLVTTGRVTHVAWRRIP
jgi:hypothetical protein